MDSTMIWKIAKKEFLLNLMTFKFTVGTIVCVVLTAVFIPILAKDYQQRLEDYNTNVTANEAELGKVKVYKNIRPTVYRRPNVLSVFSEGLDKQIGLSAQIRLGGVSEISAASADSNPFLSIFPTLDVMLILKIIMSILALLVAYNTISGEREQGTLRLMLSYTVIRYQVLLGKLLAGLVTLIIPVTSAFIVGLLIIQFFPMVSLAGADWVRIGLMYIASLIFISAMYNIGLLFSCLMRRANISLVFGLFVWIVFTVVIPNGSVYLANYLRPTEAREKMDAQIEALKKEANDKIDKFTKTLRTGGNQGMAMGAFRGIFIVYCEKALMDDYKKEYTFSEPVKIRCADRIFEVQKQYLDGLNKQKYLASTISQISPVTVYESLMSALAGTDLASFEHYRNRIKLHSDNVIEYIRLKTNNFSLPSYFTQFSEKNYEGEKKWDYQKILKQTTPINLQDLPRFTYGHESFVRTLHRTISPILLLIFVNIFFFILSFVAFLKYDIR